MHIQVFRTKEEMGQAAAEKGTEILVNAIERKGKTVFVVASAASQREFLQSLVSMGSVDWSKSVMFHLDEYVGMSISHPASFRKWLQERVVDLVHPGAYHFVNGDAEDTQAECRRIGNLLSAEPIDLAFVGIGENGHLAFNDPPADFDTQEPFLIVNLDEKCRSQQVGEGWFKTLDDVPTQAISMSVSAVMNCGHIICCVPDQRKAKAVRDCLASDAEITNRHPCSILRKHPKACIYLDHDSASLLENGKP